MKRAKDTTVYPLSEVRKRLGLRQADVALLLNVSVTAVSQWERQAARPYPLWIPELARVYRLDVPTLLTMIKPPESDYQRYPPPAYLVDAVGGFDLPTDSPSDVSIESTTVPATPVMEASR